MSQHVADILEEINQLGPQEMAELYQALRDRISRIEQVQSVLATYRGKGAGIWSDEPQQYVNNLRDNDRF